MNYAIKICCGQQRATYCDFFILNIVNVQILMAEVMGVLNYIHTYVHWLLTFRPKF